MGPLIFELEIAVVLATLSFHMVGLCRLVISLSIA